MFKRDKGRDIKRQKEVWKQGHCAVNLRPYHNPDWCLKLGLVFMCLFDSVFSTLLQRRSYSSLNANLRHTQLLWIWRNRPTCIQYIQRHTNTPWCMFWGSPRSHDLDAWELFKAITTGAKRRIRATSPSSLNSAQLWIILTWIGWALWLATQNNEICWYCPALSTWSSSFLLTLRKQFLPSNSHDTYFFSW